MHALRLGAIKLLDEGYQGHPRPRLSYLPLALPSG
jgi:hypothetical protein